MGDALPGKLTLLALEKMAQAAICVGKSVIDNVILTIADGFADGKRLETSVGGSLEQSALAPGETGGTQHVQGMLIHDEGHRSESNTGQQAKQPKLTRPAGWLQVDHQQHSDHNRRADGEALDDRCYRDRGHWNSGQRCIQSVFLR